MVSGYHAKKPAGQSRAGTQEIVGQDKPTSETTAEDNTSKLNERHQPGIIEIVFKKSYLRSEGHTVNLNNTRCL